MGLIKMGIGALTGGLGGGGWAGAGMGAAKSSKYGGLIEALAPKSKRAVQQPTRASQELMNVLSGMMTDDELSVLMSKQKKKPTVRGLFGNDGGQFGGGWKGPEL